MRSFAFRASLIISRTNRYMLFEREIYAFLDLAMNSYDRKIPELRDKFMDLTSNWTQKVDFHDGVRSLTIYEIQWPYVVAAAIVSIISVVCLASLFWGWWELGRDVSLNPLEIALAFDSSMFQEVNSNSRRSRIVRAVGRQKVKYAGELEKKNLERYVQEAEESSSDLRLLRPRLKFNNNIDDYDHDHDHNQKRNEHRDDDVVIVMPRSSNRFR